MIVFALNEAWPMNRRDTGQEIRTVITDDISGTAFNLRGPATVQINLYFQWKRELNGDNWRKATDLLAQVLDGALSSEEALALLKSEHK
jgi:hypothetical protein